MAYAGTGGTDNLPIFVCLERKRVQVMRNPDSSRRGNPPVLKSGEKWPCVTLHVPPNVTPVQHVMGAAAASSAELCAAVDAAAAQYAAPADCDASQSGGEGASVVGEEAAARLGEDLPLAPAASMREASPGGSSGVSAGGSPAGGALHGRPDCPIARRFCRQLQRSQVHAPQLDLSQC